jgi:trehalose/maltose hydrolase-like predicted phosphorylase
VMRACAEYWVSRVEHDAARDCYEISNVVCADEYAEHVNNDAFTNASVAQALRVTARAAQLLGEAVPSAWLQIADRMYVAYDEERQIHIEYDGYDGQQTKQADVELLSYPLEYTTDAAQVARDLDFYGQVIDPNGPAMSLSIYAILSAQLGRTRAAYEFLRRSYAPNATGPFWAFSETPTNHAYLFCTGLGGALQALLFGFSGIRLYEKVLTLRPVLAPHWTSLRLRGLYLLGARTDLDVDCDGFTLCRATPAGELRLRVDESARTVRLLDAPPETHIVVEGSQVSESETTPAGHDIALPPDDRDLRLRILARGDPVLDLLIPARKVAPD